MPVSIADVAQRARVSPGTVSHVLNGNTRARISEATQERVRRAAEELDYHPNRIARSLGRRRTDTLGLMLPGIQNPFYLQILGSVERLAQEAGYHVLLDASAAHLGMCDRTWLRGWPVDGVLMWAWITQNLEQFLGPQAREMPVVYLSGQPRPDDCDAVYFDVYSGSRRIMEYMIGKGYRKIAFLFPYDWVVGQLDEPRYRAYREVCSAAGISLQLIPMEQHEESRHAGLLAGLALAAMPAQARPDAVMCFNDVVAQGVLFGLRRAGVRVPEDMAVAGFDGLEEGQYLDVPLTTVLLPTDTMCREALRILQRRIREGSDAPSEAMAVPTQLIVGGTA